MKDKEIMEMIIPSDSKCCPDCTWWLESLLILPSSTTECPTCHRTDLVDANEHAQQILTNMKRSVVAQTIENINDKKLARCPACTVEFADRGQVGDVAVCSRCGMILKWNDDLNLVYIPREEIVLLSAEEYRRVMRLHDLARMSAYGKLSKSSGGEKT